MEEYYNIITQILVFIIGVVLVKYNRDDNKLRVAESNLRQQELRTISDGIKRLHARIDEIKSEQKELHDDMNGKDGLLVRVARIEEKLKEVS